MLWTLALAVMVLWALGVLGSVAGLAIHSLLVVATSLTTSAWWSGRQR
jgi:hypothetical protein